MTGWTALGLEAAGVNPLDVRSGGESPISYMRDSVDRLRAVGDLERTILVLVGAGLDPRRFAGEDLVANLRAKRDSDGSVDGQVNLTAFYVLAMRAAGVDSSSLERSARWLRAAQSSDGGWGIQPRAPSEADSTGAALQGLAAAGGGGRAAADGVRFLRRAQQRNGGWALATTGIVNAQSTAWAIQGLVAADTGGDVIDDGLRYLERLRQADGHYSYSPESDQTPIWVTTQVVLALEREAFPLAPVERRHAPSRRQSSSTQPDEPASPGDGGAPRSASSDQNAPNRDDAGDGPRRGGAPEPDPAGGSPDDEIRAAPTPESQEVPVDAAPAVSTPAAAPAEDDDDSTVIWLIVGFTALAAALGGGLAWYNRRLP
jgi:energy-coupling factor transport system substrate-specific component